MSAGLARDRRRRLQRSQNTGVQPDQTTMSCAEECVDLHRARDALPTRQRRRLCARPPARVGFRGVGYHQDRTRSDGLDDNGTGRHDDDGDAPDSEPAPGTPDDESPAPDDGSTPPANTTSARYVGYYSCMTAYNWFDISADDATCW
ncbi:MAG: hypothetical protein SGJ13_04255 [Actinomycetota bacterium]|nr:hypothetical protein [Actinomycetota bacterium]